MPIYPAIPKDAAQIPIGAVWVPNVGWVALQGSSSINTDSGGYQSTPASFNLAPLTSSTSTLTNVGASTTAGGVQLVASNGSRKGFYVENDSSAVLYLAFAGSASTTAYTVQVPANSFFEMPTSPIYTGAIYGIWSSAVGSARITELS